MSRITDVWKHQMIDSINNGSLRQSIQEVLHFEDIDVRMQVLARNFINFAFEAFTPKSYEKLSVINVTKFIYTSDLVGISCHFGNSTLQDVRGWHYSGKLQLDLCTLPELFSGYYPKKSEIYRT